VKARGLRRGGIGENRQRHHAPVSGEISEVNAAVVENPALVNSDFRRRLVL
jgi:hypothetical protein